MKKVTKEKVSCLIIVDHICQEKSRSAKYTVKTAALHKYFLNKPVYGVLKEWI